MKRVQFWVSDDQYKILEKLCNHRKCSMYKLLKRYTMEGVTRDLAVVKQT